ncbi:MAG: endonuclease III [bacterium]
MIDYKKLNSLYEYVEGIKDSVLVDAPVFKVYTYKKKSLWLLVWSTVLSSRTTDKALLRVLPILEKNFSSPEDVIKCSLDDLENILKPLGFYKSKARMFWNFNYMIVNKFKGCVPRTLKDLTGLPGVGVKVASIIMSELFGENMIAVDVHVFRILNRVGVLNTKTPEQTWKILSDPSVKLKKDIYLNLNKYLVAFGQVICKVKPKCNLCSFRYNCNYYKNVNKV